MSREEVLQDIRDGLSNIYARVPSRLVNEYYENHVQAINNINDMMKDMEIDNG